MWAYGMVIVVIDCAAPFHRAASRFLQKFFV